MIRPKVEVGAIVYFAREMSFDFYGNTATFMAIVEGEVTHILNSKKFVVKWKDDNGVTVYEHDLPLRKIHSFQWGGIITTNTKRDKKLFETMGL